MRKILAGFLTAALLWAGAARADQNTVTPIPGPPLTMATLATFLNQAFLTMGSCFSGASAPAVFSAAAKQYQCWWDTTTNPAVLNYYDGASWVPVLYLNTTSHAVSFNKLTITPPATSATLTIANGKTLTVSNSGTLSGGDGFTLSIAAAKSLTVSNSLTLAGTDGKSLTVSNTGTLAGGDAWVLAIAAGKTLTVSNSLTFTGTDGNSFAFPSGSGTVDIIAAAQTLTNKTINGASNTLTILAASQLSGQTPLANGGTAQATAAAARASAGLNVESFTGHGDSIYTILATDKVVGTNAAFSASRTWTLPAANAVNPGQPLLVADFQGTVTGTNTLVIARAGADTINGSTSVTIAAANGAYLLWSDGTSKWTAQAIGATATAGVASIGGLTGAVGVANGIEVSGSNIQVTAARRTLPTIQSFTSGTNATYTTPANVLWIEVYLVAGGGGGGAGDNGTPATTGGSTCLKASGTACTSPLASAVGGIGGSSAANNTNAGTGGATTGCTRAGQGNTGGVGSVGTAGSSGAGASGGGSAFLGGGAGGNYSTGTAAAANTGGGGGGGGTNSGLFIGGGGGGGGGSCYLIINSPAASYVYTVGSGGNGASASTNGLAGGTGGSGYVQVIEHYGTLLIFLIGATRRRRPANDNYPQIRKAA